MARPRDYAAVAKRYRDQAEEFRVKTTMMSNIDTRAQYDNLADAFEKVADSEDTVGRNMDGLAK